MFKNMTLKKAIILGLAFILPGIAHEQTASQAPAQSATSQFLKAHPQCGACTNSVCSVKPCPTCCDHKFPAKKQAWQNCKNSCQFVQQHPKCGTCSNSACDIKPCATCCDKKYPEGGSAREICQKRCHEKGTPNKSQAPGLKAHK